MAEQQYTTGNARAILRATFGPEHDITGDQVRLVQWLGNECREAAQLVDVERSRRLRAIRAELAREWDRISLAHVRPHD